MLYFDMLPRRIQDWMRNEMIKPFSAKSVYNNYLKAGLNDKRFLKAVEDVSTKPVVARSKGLRRT